MAVAAFKSPEQFKKAQAFYEDLTAALKAVPAYSHTLSADQKQDRERALALVEELFSGVDGAVRKRFDGTVVRAFGIRASSTSGFEGACNNWRSQFTLKAMGQCQAGEG